MLLCALWAKIIPPRGLPALLLEMFFEPHDRFFTLLLKLLSGQIGGLPGTHETAVIALHETDWLAIF